MIGALSVVASLLSAVALAHGAWWTLLSVVALPRPRTTPPSSSAGWRFAVIIPAHNEEARIGRCVASLRASRYTPQPQLIVVADNCTDATADIARRSGAIVFERRSHDRGKSYALTFALRQLAVSLDPADAVVVVDGDSYVSPGFFPALAARLDRGAVAVQVHYAAEAVPGSLPALRRLALGLVHWSRPLGAARLGLGTSLKGNGMAFRVEAARIALEANGLAEDAAATLALARADIAVTFEPNATVWGPMASSYAQARTQDRRWEGGRLALIPRALTVAFARALRGRAQAAHGAFECAGLPLSLLVLVAATAIVLAVASWGSLALASAAAASLLTYVFVGLAAVRPPLRDLLALRAAPRFLVYKLGVLAGLLRRPQASWDRTDR